eukprot:gnl/TRDRNA2_/TRDRNA2_209255_c0_seq1.p1 gnl/TRDRNA2_/TRDRNA2_209255_c0~~gnl/TRDRNA2_/TRDRNA2_209255_c0_seq1.p1  ORF type:complete len:152 (-),score=12.23 gnl/TRDRNA2_/TRDRNA2_209255_c0_seq1:121-576(-)
MASKFINGFKIFQSIHVVRSRLKVKPSDFKRHGNQRATSNETLWRWVLVPPSNATLERNNLNIRLLPSRDLRCLLPCYSKEIFPELTEEARKIKHRPTLLDLAINNSPMHTETNTDGDVAWKLAYPRANMAAMQLPECSTIVPFTEQHVRF